MGLLKFLVNKLLLQKWEKADEYRFLNYKYPKNIRAATDIEYINDKHRGHLLDIFYPEDLRDKLPVIIEIHGGGFFHGYKEKNRPYCYELAKRGSIVFSLNYRLALNDTKVPGQIQDILAALYWISENLYKYPADKNKIFITGDSAGGYLAAIATLITKNERLQKIFNTLSPDINIKALGINCGFMTFEEKKLAYRLVRSMTLERDYKKQDYYYNMILNNIPEMKYLPPVFMTSGVEDELKQMTLSFEKVLKKFNIKYKLKFFKKKKGFKLGHVFSVNFPDKPESQIVIDEMSEFFKENI